MAGNNQNEINVGLRKIVDLYRKIDYVAKSIGISIEIIVIDLADAFYKTNKRTPSRWFKDAIPEPDKPKLSALRHNACEEIKITLLRRNILFHDDWFKVTFGEFCSHYDNSARYKIGSLNTLKTLKETDADGDLRVSAIKGVYQILRPYMTDHSKYVAEIMAISSNQNHFCDLRMYSHRASEPEYIYSGALYVDSRYCSALVRRPHESDVDRILNRNILLHVDFQRRQGSYVSMPAYCGIILRGLTGLDGKKAGGIPFIAIKTAHEITVMDAGRFTDKPVSGIKQVARCLLVGEISKKHIGIFSFCDKLFRALNVHTKDEFGLFTVGPKTVESIVLDFSPNINSCYESWENAVAHDLREAV